MLLEAWRGQTLFPEKTTALPLTICPMPESLLTADQVADLLGVPRSWVYEQSRRGTIPTVTLGRYRRYRSEAIEAWVAEMEAGGLGRRSGLRVA